MSGNLACGYVSLLLGKQALLRCLYFCVCEAEWLLWSSCELTFKWYTLFCKRAFFFCMLHLKQSAPVTFSWFSLQKLNTRSRDFSSFHHGLNPEFFPGLMLCGESPVPYLAVGSQVTLILLWIEPLYSQTRDRDIQSKIEHVDLRWIYVIWVSLNLPLWT